MKSIYSKVSLLAHDQIMDLFLFEYTETSTKIL